MVTITRHIFINICQTEHFSAVKFAMGYKKNMSFRVITKSPKVWKKKVEKIGLGSFKQSWHIKEVILFYQQPVVGIRKKNLGRGGHGGWHWGEKYAGEQRFMEKWLIFATLFGLWLRGRAFSGIREGECPHLPCATTAQNWSCLLFWALDIHLSATVFLYNRYDFEMIYIRLNLAYIYDQIFTLQFS